MAMPQSQPGFDYDSVWSFGERLRKARRKPLIGEKRSMTDFAEALGVSNQMISNWENDLNRPRDIVAVAWRVSELTGYPVMWLLKPSVIPTESENTSRSYYVDYAYCATPVLGVIHGVSTLFDPRPYETFRDDPLLRLVTRQEEESN